MPAATIVAVAQSLYLCDGHIGFPGGKTVLMGLFNSSSNAADRRPINQMRPKETYQKIDEGAEKKAKEVILRLGKRRFGSADQVSEHFFAIKSRRTLCASHHPLPL
jgi:hypothetical protein